MAIRKRLRSILWRVPVEQEVREELAHHRADLRGEHFHCIVAEIDGAVVGQITVVPAARAGNPVDDPARQSTLTGGA